MPRWASQGLMALMAAGLAFAAVEGMGRMLGLRPGDISPNWLDFHPVDSLMVRDDFISDSLGIVRANAGMGRVYGRPVNSHGFFSPECMPKDSTRKRLLLIGDSFAWGMSASVPDSCFAERMRREGDWEIVNLGIPTADPVQYALIAERYIPTLKPDAVMLFFFMGNDIMAHDRQPVPGRPIYFITNAGAIAADADGIPFKDAHEAYLYFTQGKYWLSGDRPWHERAIARSAVLSRVYSLKFRWEERQQWERRAADLSLTAGYLLRVREAAIPSGAAFHIVVIPELREIGLGKAGYFGKYASLLRHPVLFAHFSMPETDKRHFRPYPDAHLNDEGHRIYADHCMGILRE